MQTEKEVWEKIQDLKEHPEWADTPGYKVESLRREANVADCLSLLPAQPQFIPPEEWWFPLRRRCDIPWAKLLTELPQLERFVHWESVNRLELVKLAYMAPGFFEKRFPKGRPWDLYAFLTPLEKQLLLSDLPQLENKVDWDELEEEWSAGNWMMLLACQPQFERYFDWSRIEKKPSPYWEFLLRMQPQFACHCRFADLEDWQVRRIRKRQPQLFEKEQQL